MAGPTKDEIAELMEVHTGAVATSERLLRSYGLDDTRSWVDPNGHRLSDRVWGARRDVRKRIDDTLRRAIAEGTDALVVADLLESSLLPELQPVRMVGGEFVANQRRGIVTSAPNVKEYAGSLRPFAGSFPARRLARTEITRAHGAAVIWSAERTPGNVGVKWSTSGRHPKADECDQKAERDAGLGKGVYPPKDVPQYPSHPMCLCNLAQATTDDVDGLIENLRAQYGLGEDLVATPGLGRGALPDKALPLTPQWQAVRGPLRPGASDLFATPPPTLLQHADRAKRIKAAGSTVEPATTRALAATTEGTLATMPSQQQDALRSYFGSGYRRINDASRGKSGFAPTAETVADIGHMEQAFAQHTPTLPTDTKIYRGRSWQPEESVPGYLTGLKPGDTLTDWGWSSYSIDRDVAFGSFGGGSATSKIPSVTFEVLAPKGTRGLYANPLSKHPNEQEVLLPRGSTIIVHSVKQTGNRTVVVAEVLD